MLHRPSSIIQLCHDRAAECEELAELSSNTQIKADYLRLAQNWRELAGSHDFTETMGRLINQLKDMN